MSCESVYKLVEYRDNRNETIVDCFDDFAQAYRVAEDRYNAKDRSELSVNIIRFASDGTETGMLR